MLLITSLSTYWQSELPSKQIDWPSLSTAKKSCFFISSIHTELMPNGFIIGGKICASGGILVVERVTTGSTVRIVETTGNV